MDQSAIKKMVDSRIMEIAKATEDIKTLQSVCAHNLTYANNSNICFHCQKQLEENKNHFIEAKYSEICGCINCNCPYSEEIVKQYLKF